MEVAKGIGRLFYIISPNETSFEKLEDLPHPDYVTKAIPYFTTLIILEYLVQIWRNKRRTRLNDGIVSMSHGLYLVCQEILFKGVENYFYIKIYENWRIVDLPWNSPWTWYLTLVGVDLGYYVVHRMCHEVNIFWAQHQVHHSSEDYNLTTALRQGAFQHWCAWVFYLPLAFFIPSPIYLIHQQFNLLFQFWIHTEVIESLGPLEWILNTPKHHRIHHGSNRYCLDKNYAGVFIIWSATTELLQFILTAPSIRIRGSGNEMKRYDYDYGFIAIASRVDRMFGTFEEEKPGEKIVYGLVEDVKSFNPFWLQTFYYPKIWNRMKDCDNIWDKLSVMFKGPGWSPEKPHLRLGDINDVPEFPTREPFDVALPLWKNVYAGFHFLVCIVLFHVLSENELMFSQITVFLIVGFILFSLTSIGFVLEDRPVGGIIEILRASFVILYLFLSPGTSILLRQLMYGIYGISIGLWSIQLGLLKDETKTKTS